MAVVQPLDVKYETDANGNPAGGTTKSTGLDVTWQNGPLVGPGGERLEPNGCFVETLLRAVEDRIIYYQSTKFKSIYNAEALTHVSKALHVLGERTQNRERRKVEGTHEV